MLVPTHLNEAEARRENLKFQVTPISEEEILLRRFSGPDEAYQDGDYFQGISSDYIDNGVSCNRQKYCRMPEDVLWSHSESPPAKSISECNYVYKDGRIIFLKVAQLRSDAVVAQAKKHGLEIDAFASGSPCNISHADVKVQPAITPLKKHDRQKARLFLATLFQILAA